jgi:hypothetical protein
MGRSNQHSNTDRTTNELSSKHRVLVYIFDKYYRSDSPQSVIPFYLDDIGEAYEAIGEPKPASVSNTVLDLVRKDRGIRKRVPPSIIDLGYDLKKKTGPDGSGRNYAGEFVHVGVGNEIQSWLTWPQASRNLVVPSESLPKVVLNLIRKDEAALFSILDYFDVLNIALKPTSQIFRVQNPMKWQPNEIDGLYVSLDEHMNPILYPVEAKALTTKDDVNLDQLQGGYRTVLEKVRELGLEHFSIRQLAVMMIPNGLKIAIFPPDASPERPEEVVQINFLPAIQRWT